MGLFGWRRARREGEPSKLEYLNRYTLGLGRIAFTILDTIADLKDSINHALEVNGNQWS